MMAGRLSFEGKLHTLKGARMILLFPSFGCTTFIIGMTWTPKEQNLALSFAQK